MAGFAILIAVLALAAPDARSQACSGPEVRAALVEFTHAYNRGAYAALDELFAPEPRFQWYSTDAPGARLSPRAKQRRTLIPYFEARHRRHDRFRLRSFGFNGSSRSYGNFEMEMRRRADGFRGGDWFRVRGKGAALCGGEDVRFIVLTFGTMP